MLVADALMIFAFRLPDPAVAASRPERG